MFTTGKLIFALVFVLVFIAAMFWSYKKDSVSSKIHFKGVFKILLVIILSMTVLVLFVKMRH